MRRLKRFFLQVAEVEVEICRDVDGKYFVRHNLYWSILYKNKNSDPQRNCIIQNLQEMANSKVSTIKWVGYNFEFEKIIFEEAMKVEVVLLPLLMFEDFIRYHVKKIQEYNIKSDYVQLGKWLENQSLENKVKTMTATSAKMTLAEFIDYDDGTDRLYELENGELILMPSESEINRRIAMFLLIYFSQLGIPPQRLTMKMELAVSGSRVSVRVPDLMVLSKELEIALEGATRSIVMMEMPPPLLVVEVVSPNQEKRDYRYKRTEYAARGIAEYWIVDPMLQQVTILEWVEGLYEEKVYTGNDAIASSVFENLDLTVDRILQEK
ncbi:Uma2 family endonuclease [Zarconia navalis]|nr:Uma2 family endonuclease [Zarconia navalis]